MKINETIVTISDVVIPACIICIFILLIIGSIMENQYRKKLDIACAVAGGEFLPDIDLCIKPNSIINLDLPNK